MSERTTNTTRVIRTEASSLTLVTPTSEEDVLCTIGETAPRLDCQQVDAVCTSVEKKFFAPFKQEKFIFTFSVIRPEEHAGNLLSMYVRWNSRWKTPPIASKIYKLAAIASGRLSKKQRVTKHLFVHRVFRCRVKQVGEGAASYTIVDTILEKLTG
jgi:hypothetical protein